MKIDLFIDANVWDIFFKRNIDLSIELPATEFNLKITKQAEFEIQKMPAALREYAEKYLSQKMVKTELLLGFYDESIPPDQQRYVGFGCEYDSAIGGRFVEEDEAKVMQGEPIGPGVRPTGLLKNEADVALSAMAHNSFVLTCDTRGALKRAKEKSAGAGGVIDLNNFTQETHLRAFIQKEIGFLKNQS